MELPSLHLLSLVDPTEMMRPREEDGWDSDDDVPLSQRRRIDPAPAPAPSPPPPSPPPGPPPAPPPGPPPAPPPKPKLAVPFVQYGNSRLQADARVYLDGTPHGYTWQTFTAAAILVAYACERILYPNSGKKLDFKVEKALQAIFEKSHRVYTNLTSIRWFRIDKRFSFERFLDNAVTMNYKEIGVFPPDTQCEACGQRNEREMYEVKMVGWESEAYRKFSPTKWNREGLLNNPAQYAKSFRRFLKEYSREDIERNNGFFRRTYRVGSTCAALCTHAMIAKSFFVEAMYECQVVKDEGASFEPPVPVFPPEQINTFQSLPDDGSTIDNRSETFLKRIPGMLAAIELASRETDGTELRRNVGMPKRKLLPSDDGIDDV
jgi:hypothetical protein